MNIITTSIPDVLIFEPKVFEDSRGYFFESFSQREFETAIGRKIDFVQDNQSKSCRGVIRGLHFQQGDFAQAKLVRCVVGKVLDVALDIRPDSPTYGKYVTAELSDENRWSIYIPRGFAHGFAVLSEMAVFQYKCDNYYCKESEGGFSPLDPTLAIDWRVAPSEAILSPKDTLLPPFIK